MTRFDFGSTRSRVQIPAPRLDSPLFGRTSRKRNGSGVLLVALALTLSFAAPARADYALSPSNPVIHDPVTTSAVAYAHEWWAALGVYSPCPSVTVRLYDDPSDGAIARAFGVDAPAAWACTIWIQADVRRYVLRSPRHSRLSNRAGYCGFMLHEYGHVAGLTHADGGIMGDATPPGGCWTWADFSEAEKGPWAESIPRRAR